ncbi:hypothetical protein [Glaciecola petra]|uniref:Uncharacterized protein n=1 Tax=Glaciecola petra TaxID=3075602 RepID=A0ABU2ZS31_9ALTE|nr:hypothetical protein [Aestuariibacter sp. P117]MDT0595061.1 hypothetical protein [Aestuariibacter sp. P117]
MNKFTLLTQFLVLVFLVAAITVANAQQMDAKLNMAKRELMSIESKLKTIKTGDVSQYNRISEQLTKTSNLLQTTESKTHPDYVVSVQKWSSLRQNMVEIAQTWQTAQSEQTAQRQQATQKSKLDLDKILSKYQRENRPKLSQNPSPSEVTLWARKMKALQTDILQADLSILNKSDGSNADTQRVKAWISGNFQEQISQDINLLMQQFNSQIEMAVQLSRQLENINSTQKMKVYNFAYGENGQRNAATLQQGLLASANGKVLDDIFPNIKNPNRQDHLALIAFNQQNFEVYQEQAAQTHIELASVPKKKKPVREDFIKGIYQKLWYRGSELASIDRKGSIWMNNRDVGDVTANGRIWVGSNDLGSIEKDGKVWFRGRHIGTLEENGKVWRGGTQVGLVEPNGKVWVDGNSNGEIVPFEGEWKRAAIIYFFRDIFAE